MTLQQSFIDSVKNGWFGATRTDRRRKAVEHLLQSIDAESHHKLPPLIIMAPAFDLAGQSFQYQVSPDLTLVYLAPWLEIEKQVYVDFITVHEFAHVVLGHTKERRRLTPEELSVPHHERPDELAAEELATKWGFRRPTHKLEFMKLFEEIL